MLPFVGEYLHSLDNKGRIIIPAKFRNNFGEKIYLCKGFENCLLILTPGEIEKIEKKIQSDTLSNKDVRKFMRVFFSGMVEGNFDSQGRIIVPSGLKNYAGIDSEAYIVGTGFYVEIWDKDAWDQSVEDADDNREDLAFILEENRG